LDNDINLNELLLSNLFCQLRSLDLIDEIQLRNLRIRQEYKRLRSNIPSPVCLQLLMDKYSLSDSALNSILFRTVPDKYKAPDF
jgi:hypothetical protein